MIIVLAGIFFFMFLSGVYHLLQGIWELRLGVNRNVFVTKCMLGAGLIVAAFLLPSFGMFVTSVHAVQPAP